MKRKQLLCKLRSPERFLPGLLFFLLLLTVSACGNKNSVQVYDNAGVLDNSKVQRAASNLPNPIAIYTTNTFQGTQADFQRTAIQKLKGNSNMIVMAIDTNSHYIYIARGSQVPLSSAGINQAISSFAGHYRSGNYTNASIAALNSMQESIRTSSQGRGGGSFSPAIPCLIIPLLLILGAVLFSASRRARLRSMTNRGGFWGAPRNPQANEGPYYGPNQGPNQGYGPYNQDYYGPPNQRRGMNPWAAGGLGAAAGGLAGYELGRRAGDQNPDRNADGGDFGGGGNFGGDGETTGAGGDFGGGGNFGNGDDQGDFGGGGNFGGGFGGSNFFGGGGSFGEDGGDVFGGGGSFGSGNDSGGGGNF